MDAFSIGQCELTFDEYDAFARKTGRQLLSAIGLGRGRRPVINVSWNDATAYSKWLSQQTGKRYRPPTEAKWEYAARAGTTTPFRTGRCVTTRPTNYGGNYDYNKCGANPGHYRNRAVAAGSLPANLWGLHGVLANILVWTCSSYNRNSSGDQSRCGTDDARALRGGLCSIAPELVRTAVRA